MIPIFYLKKIINLLDDFFLKKPFFYIMSKFFILLITGIWLGLLIGLSFIEAPLKFQAPDMTQKLALGIGELVFGVLSKIELAFAILLTGLTAYIHKDLGRVALIAIGCLVVMVLLQFFVLMPILMERIAIIQADGIPPESKKHLLYIFVEVLKVITLFTIFYKVYKA